MSIQFRDTISPGLRALMKGVNDRKPILEAMGLQLESLTKRAFNEPALRPAPWPNKLSISKDGFWFTRSEPSRLRKNQVLVRSIRITELTNSRVTVGTDRIYAAIHQLGGVIRPKNSPVLLFKLNGTLVAAKKVTIPARPFFPFLNGRMMESAQAKIRAVAEAKLQALVRRTSGAQ